MLVAGVVCLVQSEAEDDVANKTLPQQTSLDNKKPSTTIHPAEIIRLDMDASATHFLPITFQDVDLGPSDIIANGDNDTTEGDDDARARRSPQRNNEDYDDKYKRFKKSFNNRKARGNYRVEDNDDESGEDEEDNDDEEESGSEEQPKKSKKVKSAKNNNGGTDEDYDRIRDESQKAKKSKYCRVERRGNMFCNVCYNPKNGDSAESCSFRTDPHEKKYAFSKEKKYKTKDGEPEKEREFVTQRPYYRARAPYTRPVPAPQYRRPGFTMAYVPRYGYVFAPNRRPPPPAPHHPIPQRNSAYGKSVPKRYIYAGQESRPQREVVGVASSDEPKDESLEDIFSDQEDVHVNRLKKNHTKNEEDDHEYHPKYSAKDGVDKILAEFKTKDWSNCEHSIKGDLSCYLCKNSDGGKQEECVYDSGSQNNNKPYYSELKSYSETAFGDDYDVENYFKNKNKNALKKAKKTMPKKATTKKPKVESSTTGNYNLKTTFGEVEDHLTPEADLLFPWDTPGPAVKQAKRMVTATYRKENRNPDESRVTVFGHKVVHTQE